MKSGNLNFLEPSGPLQACNGTALPLPLIVAVWSLGVNRWRKKAEDRSARAIILKEAIVKL